MSSPVLGVQLPGEGPGVRIAHVSDIHVGAHDELTLDGLADDLAQFAPAATVVTGDLTMRARSHQFKRAAEVMRGFPAPLMVVLGNHDIPLHNPVARMTRPYQSFRELVTPDLDPVLDLPAGVRIQGLQSMPRWRWKSGRVSDRQGDLVVANLGSTPTGWARIVAMHHPISSEHLETIAGADDLTAALIAAEVDVVLAGHTHIPAVRMLTLTADGRSRQVIEVIAGTATSHRTRGVPRSWSLLEFTARTLTVTERVNPGQGWAVGNVAQLELPAGAHLSTS